MKSRKILSIVISILIGFSLFPNTVMQKAVASSPPPPDESDGFLILEEPPSAEDIQEAAKRSREKGILPGVAGFDQLNRATHELDPGGIPHYFGPFANYAYSPLPKGSIESITVDAPGSGYTSPVISVLDVYGTGSGAVATATLSSGRITAITVVEPGSGYSAPIIDIQDTTGNGALATANLLPDNQSGIRKFIDKLPGLGPENANLLGQYIPIAVPDTETFPGSDYYEIEIIEYTEQMHSDLPPTTLRGYRQTNGPNPDIEAHYFGPMIMATKDRPVRITFTNNLGTGEDGKLFIPVDTTIMGAGPGPLDRVNLGEDCNVMMGGDCEYYTENRTSVHLHGAFVPWISDGTPHQWFTPEGEITQYTEGASYENVPDMWYDPSGNIIPNTTGQTTPPDPTALKSFPGKMTFFYNNEELGARLQFAHDHAWGITRLNVYVGMANGFLITDEFDQDLINGTNNTGINPNLISVFPDLGIPLIIQDKTFIDETTIAAQDPTWRWGSDTFDPNNPGAFSAHTGDLWMPSVYMPIQDPYVEGGANAFGRWHYGPWFWPPTANSLQPVPNEYSCDVSAEPCDIELLRPNVPSPSMGMETFFDTPTVNGTVYPYLEVDPEVVRFRILNIANDRFLNLQFYVADPDVITADGRRYTEVKMVPADPNPEFPELWPTDGRVGGVPDPKTAGPDWIQIGTEGGFLPDPVVIPPQPMTYVTDAGLFNVGNVKDHSLLLGTAERADVLVDFSQYAGQTLILYNDSTAPFPAYDPRYDYYTGHPDLTSSGGAPTTQPGYGPNTRTIMQIRVRAAGEVPDSSVVSVDVLNSGSGYSTMPTVGFYGGGGTGAAAFATGSVDQIVPTTSASEFLTEAPVVHIVGGGGSGATAVANLVNGQIASYTVTNGGSGYTSAPKVILSFDNSDLPYRVYLPIFWGNGSGNGSINPFGTATATLKVSKIEVSDGGSGYSSAPNVSLLYGGGSGASARANLTAGPAYDIAPLEYIFAKDSSSDKPGLFEASQNRIIVPQAAYNTAYDEQMPGDFRAYVQVGDNSISFFNGPLTGLDLTQGGSGYTTAPTVTITGGGGTGATATATITGDTVTGITLDTPGDGYVSEPSVTFTGGGGSGAQAKALGVSYDLENKAIQDEMGEAFDEYGRMSGFLGLEMEVGAPGGQNFILYGYSSPPVDLLKDSELSKLGELGDGTQIWKITHNGVDTHTIHIHLVNAQLINRVAWDGMLLPPEPNELGWKETFRVNPLEQTIFAIRPHAPTTQPFDVPNSVRLMDPSLPEGAMLMPPPLGQFQTPDEVSVDIYNEVVNFGWEYVWHCHLLSHEEMDMMHTLSLAVLPKPPIDLAAEIVGGGVNLTWTDNTVSETDYRILRRVAPDGVWEMLDQIPMEAGTGSPMSYLDSTVNPATTYEYQIIAVNITGLVGLLPPDNISSMPNMEAQSEPAAIQISIP
jgi:FtsP/CotA-like multicopper oxidase with cupredoxin domain